MNVYSAVGESIKRYGTKVNLINGKEQTTTKALVQPLRYRNRIYVGGELRDTGVFSRERYLYVGPPEVLLTEKKTVVCCKDKKFFVRQADVYIVNNTLVYVWGILIPLGERVVDDYEQN